MPHGVCLVTSHYRDAGVLKHTCSAYFTFVSLGDNGKPVPLPKLNANRAQPISGDGNGDNTETGGEKKENHDGVGSGGEGDSGDCTNSAGESGEMTEEEKEKEASIYMENQRRYERVRTVMY